MGKVVQLSFIWDVKKRADGGLRIAVWIRFTLTTSVDSPTGSFTN